MKSLLLSLVNEPAPAEKHGFPMGLPEIPTARAVLYAEDLWRMRQEVFGPHPLDGEGDVEDFWEMAAVLEAAMRSPADQVWLSTRTGMNLIKGEHDTSSLLSVDDRLALPLDHPEVILPYGPVPTMSSLWLRKDFNEADRYFTWPGFDNHAKRPAVTAGINADEGLELVDTIVEWVEKGLVLEGEEVIVKASRAKHGLWLVSASSNREIAYSNVNDALGWAQVNFEGSPTAFILQKKIPMSYEYRIFVVNGKLITGGGCVEEYTPLYANGNPFNGKMRQHRGTAFMLDDEGSITQEAGSAGIENRPDLVARYLDVAQDVVENALCSTFTLDLALNEDTNEVVMVEANGISNSGLYASQPRLVVEEILGYSVPTV